MSISFDKTSRVVLLVQEGDRSPREATEEDLRQAGYVRAPKDDPGAYYRVIAAQEAAEAAEAAQSEHVPTPETKDAPVTKDTEEKEFCCGERQECWEKSCAGCVRQPKLPTRSENIVDKLAREAFGGIFNCFGFEDEKGSVKENVSDTEVPSRPSSSPDLADEYAAKIDSILNDAVEFIRTQEKRASATPQSAPKAEEEQREAPKTETPKNPIESLLGEFLGMTNLPPIEKITITKIDPAERDQFLKISTEMARKLRDDFFRGLR